MDRRPLQEMASAVAPAATPVTPAGTTDPHAVDSRADTLPSDGSDTDPARPPRVQRRAPMLGKVLGHFRVDALLGEGGMGSVYRAWDTSLLRPVALKVVLADSEAARSRFLREARAQAQLRHANVVPIHYVGHADGVVFLVMDLVEGESLAERLRREERLAAERALDIADAVASALEAGALAGLIHRDVKPSNILLERGGRTLLADFGLAKEITGAEHALPESERDPGADEIQAGAAITRAGTVVGTPAYLAPEQAAGGLVDHRADMYALGVTLYEALTGATPFSGPTPTAVVEKQRTEEARPPSAVYADIHPQVERLVVRMMAKRPEDRFATWPDVRAAIAAARVTRGAPASFVPRAIAFAIDFVPVGMVAGIGLAVTRLSVVGWVAAAAVAGLSEWRFGTTLGKRLFQLRTVDPLCLAPRPWIAVLRSQVKYGGAILLGLIADLMREGNLKNALSALILASWLASLLSALGKKRAALHDRLASTEVVYALPRV